MRVLLCYFKERTVAVNAQLVYAIKHAIVGGEAAPEIRLQPRCPWHGCSKEAKKSLSGALRVHVLSADSGRGIV